LATWSPDELNRIGAAEEVRIATMRTDGTLRKPVIVWIVRAGNDLHVRSVNGRSAAWFRGVLARHEGSLQAAGSWQSLTKDAHARSDFEKRTCCDRSRSDRSSHRATGWYR
jgi:hypothetical protein